MDDGRGEEDDTHGQVDYEDPARADEFHDEGSDETTEGEAALGAGEHLSGGGVGVFGVGVDHIVDELGRDCVSVRKCSVRCSDRPLTNPAIPT